MFRQVSGECGRCLQGSCQGGPQCPEEGTKAEEAQDLPAAVTLGRQPSAELPARVRDFILPEHCRAWHLGLDSWNILELSPLGSCYGSMENEDARPTSVPLPWGRHLFPGRRRALTAALLASAMRVSLSKPNSCLKLRKAWRVWASVVVHCCSQVSQDHRPLSPSP